MAISFYCLKTKQFYENLNLRFDAGFCTKIVLIVYFEYIFFLTEPEV